MAKKTNKSYEKLLSDMVVERKGSLDAFLVPQIKIAAQCWALMDKVADELSSGYLTTLEYGSTGQAKTVINPLLAQYDKMSRTMKLHFSALGLNFDATPSKVSEASQNSDSEDPLIALLSGMNNEA